MIQIQRLSVRLILAAACASLSVRAAAQEVENVYESRAGVKISYAPIKKLTLSLAPEARMDKTFALSKFVLEGDAKFKVIHSLEVGAGYRFIEDRKKDNSFDIAHRYSLFGEYSKELGRFKNSLGVNYSNYSDDSESGNVFRYKAQMEYNIKDIPLSPFASVSAFHDIGNNTLYKMRYSAGCEWKICKNNFLVADYKLDYYRKEYKNKHIVSLGYKLNF